MPIRHNAEGVRQFSAQGWSLATTLGVQKEKGSTLKALHLCKTQRGTKSTNRHLCLSCLFVTFKRSTTTIASASSCGHTPLPQPSLFPKEPLPLAPGFE